MKKMTVCVVGLGKLGTPLAACVASKGYEVIGVDVNPATVDLVNAGKTPVYEPGLEELIGRNTHRLRASGDIHDAVSRSAITFITVPTPSDERGAFSLEFVESAGERVADALKGREGYHVIVLTSTVLPGATENVLKPLLERISGKRCGEEFGLCYSPEFIALGSVIRDFLNPDFILIGESDRRAGDLLQEFYEDVCDNDPHMARMNFVNAELTKIAVNTYVTTKITFANMLARICERIEGADSDVVASALGLDARIGGKYLKGAIGYGGPCFPRDNHALSFFAHELGADATLAEATDEANREQVARLAELVKTHLPPGGKVGILGLTYKPDTNVVEESQGVLLASRLEGEGIPYAAYDPAASIEDAAGEFAGFSSVSSLQECILGADVIVITTPWREFKDIDPALFGEGARRRTVIDCWRILDPARVREHATYRALGIGYGDDT
ncbi:MAG: UDP-glucose/GDP-mannose dehydrogenase family protein [Actinobacteria bacterium]|jgi:UDPglucose 6-dehydrogenase|nr:MAG: UDP-glucose/GDP-mannose dehydrogenase family protein [Actinomycetota bacterium]